MRILRYLWAGPTTLAGLAAAGWAIVTGGHWQVHTGVLEIWGGAPGRLLRRHHAWAITLGHVVLAADRAILDGSRVHERVHVAQTERWGAFYVPAWFVECWLAQRRGQHPYLGNRFEVPAFRAQQLERVWRCGWDAGRPV